MIAKPLEITLSALFLEMEKLFGSRDCCFLAMNSINDAIQSFEGTSEELYTEIKTLTKTVTIMSPRIALLIMMMFTILDQYERQRVHTLSLEEEKTLLSRIIEEVKLKRKKSVEKLLSFSDGIIQNGDTILLHDISHTVFDILDRAHAAGIEFSVLIAEQEEAQTATIVRFLQESTIPFTVLPEFMLTHAMDSISKAFLGAVTINSHYEVISDAGSEAIISQMKYYNIPVYVPITTDKFSLWHAENKHHTLKSTKYKSLAGIEYNKLVYSHDRYPITQVTQFITNKGLLPPDEVSALYNRYFERCDQWRKRTGV